jgi:hypothetical protein
LSQTKKRNSRNQPTSQTGKWIRAIPQLRRRNKQPVHSRICFYLMVLILSYTVEKTLAFVAIKLLSESQAGPDGFFIKASSFCSSGATGAYWAAVLSSPLLRLSINLHNKQLPFNLLFQLIRVSKVKTRFVTVETTTMFFLLALT